MTGRHNHTTFKTKVKMGIKCPQHSGRAQVPCLRHKQSGRMRVPCPHYKDDVNSEFRRPQKQSYYRVALSIVNWLTAQGQSYQHPDGWYSRQQTNFTQERTKKITFNQVTRQWCQRPGPSNIIFDTRESCGKSTTIRSWKLEDHIQSYTEPVFGISILFRNGEQGLD